MSLELVLAYASPEALEADHRDNLRKGRAFVVGGAGPCERERCRAVVVHPASGARLSLEAEVVWVKRDAPGAGVGLQLVDFGEPERERLRRFVETGADAEAEESEGGSAPVETGAGEASDADVERGGHAVPRNLYERIRALSIGDRGTVARQGTLTERVALERCYGSSVWEALLQNPQLTPPEVARIAKNGTLTRPLVQVIVGNPAWLAVPEIQRALLSNPRVSGPHLDRVLRTMSRVDLERVASLTAYRAEVRSSVQRFLRGR